MTATILPFANMNNIDPAMLQEMIRKELAALEKEQQRQVAKQKQANNWRNLTQKEDQGMGSMFGMIIMAAMFGGFFDNSIMGNVAQLGLMNMAENGQNPTLDSLSQLNNGMKSDNTAMAGMLPALMQQTKNDPMTMMLLLAFILKMTKGSEEREGRSGSGEMVAMNPLTNNFVLAQFKQNRQKMVSVKKLMDRSKNEMLDHPQAPARKYAYN